MPMTIIRLFLQAPHDRGWSYYISSLPLHHATYLGFLLSSKPYDLSGSLPDGISWVAVQEFRLTYQSGEQIGKSEGTCTETGR